MNRDLEPNPVNSVQLGSIYVGDCIQFMERHIKDLAVDLIIADPPYNIGYEYDIYNDNRPDREYLDWTYRWINAAVKLLKPDGSLWIAIGDEYVAEVKWIAQRQVGLHLRNWVVWYYTFGVQCRDKFSRSHTHLLYFVKDPSHYKFRAERIRVPSARRLVYNDARTHPAGRVPDNTWILRPQDIPQSLTPLEDTWYFARIAGTFKERARFVQCQLPEKLLARIILACSDPGDLVFDPFVGSGSTLMVAKKLARRYLGCELSPNYARWAEKRLELTNVGDPLEGPEDPLMSAPSTPDYVQYSQLTKTELANLHKGVLDCFLSVHQGYSIDRVLADPLLNMQFQDACSRAKLPGRPVDWNLALLRLRKSRRVPLPARRKTKVSRTELDAISYAAEMALRRLLDQGYPSLDYILADPVAALRFDDLARRLAPGATAFHYRWAALRLRKQAHLLRERGGHLADYLSGKNDQSALLLERGIEAMVPAGAGIYYLQQRISSRRDLVTVYIGHTRDIATTVTNLVSARDHVRALCRRPGELYISVPQLSDKINYLELGALQYREASQYKPELNYLGMEDRRQAEDVAADSS